MTVVSQVAYTVVMVTKKTEMTKQVALRLTQEMYDLIVYMRSFYGSDADVLRAGIVALARERAAIAAMMTTPPPDA